MFFAAQPQGADLLELILAAATARAQDVLGGSVSLYRCHDIELRAELDEVAFEASCISRSDDGLVIAGRFTFSTFTRPSASIATRLAQWNPGN